VLMFMSNVTTTGLMSVDMNLEDDDIGAGIFLCP